MRKYYACFILAIFMVSCNQSPSKNGTNCDCANQEDSCLILKADCEKRGGTYTYFDPLGTIHFKGCLCTCCD